MGNDGGTVIKRKERVHQVQNKERSLDVKEYNQKGKWVSCYLSNKQLVEPILSDYKGQLFNKDSILEFLIDPESFSTKQKELLQHVKSLKDLVELKLNKNDTGFICPITGNSLGSNGLKYVYLVGCKDVFAEKCLKEISLNNDNCPLCNVKFNKETELVIINPVVKEDVELLEKRIKKLKNEGLPHSLKKKSKKRKSETVGKTHIKQQKI